MHKSIKMPEVLFNLTAIRGTLVHYSPSAEFDLVTFQSLVIHATIYVMADFR